MREMKYERHDPNLDISMKLKVKNKIIMNTWPNKRIYVQMYTKLLWNIFNIYSFGLFYYFDCASQIFHSKMNKMNKKANRLNLIRSLSSFFVQLNHNLVIWINFFLFFICFIHLFLSFLSYSFFFFFFLSFLFTSLEFDFWRCVM